VPTSPDQTIELGPAASTKRLALDTFPIGIAVDDSNGDVYVLASGEILVFDPDSEAPKSRIHIVPGANHIAFDPSHHAAWVSNNRRTNDPAGRKVNILDCGSNQVIGSVELQYPAMAVGVDSATNRAFVVNRPDDQTVTPDQRGWVSVFDTDTRQLIDTIELPFAAYGIEVDSNTHSAVISGWGNTVVMSTQTFVIDRSRSIRSDSSSAAIAVDHHTGFAYVASDNKLSTIPLRGNAGLTERKVDWDDASMGVGPGSTLLVTDRGNGVLLVIDSATGGVRTRIPVGVEPIGVAGATNRKTAYVYSNSDQSVTVVRFK
jgi:YVTN family beta-propeller protein